MRSAFGDSRGDESGWVGIARERALRRPEARAYVYLCDGELDAEEMSYGELDRRAKRIAAALAFRASNNQTCPTPTGYSDPRLSKLSFQNAPDKHLWVSKPAARMNRILRRGS